MTRPTPVASLPMYDWPEVQGAHDALWSAIAGRLNENAVAAPAALERRRSSEEVWSDPGLVLSQTCGYPYATRLRGCVRLVATPIYAADGCEGPSYSSAIIVRREEAGRRLSDFAGRRFAFNSLDSLSGYVAPRAAMREEERLDPDAFNWMETGGHRESIRTVASGASDIASIDSVCWALATEHETANVAKLKVIAWTAKRPGLPYVTARNRSDADLSSLRAALDHAMTAPGTEVVRNALFLAGFGVLGESDYEPIAALSG